MLLKSGNRTNSNVRSPSFVNLKSQIERTPSYVSMNEQKVNNELQCILFKSENDMLIESCIIALF